MQRHCLEKNYFIKVCAYFNHQVISLQKQQKKNTLRLTLKVN